MSFFDMIWIGRYLGIPGTINSHSGRVQNANTTGLIGHPFQQDLERLLGRPIAMENDANCFTLAEARQGAAKGFPLVFGIILGTGCGGGICIDGQLHTGKHQIAGEWGHFTVDPAGELCYCGNSGCVETKISGGGVAKAFAKQFGRRLTLEQIKKVPKVVGVSGGPQKVAAIRAALKGRLVNVLITDSVTAEKLLEEA